MIAKDTEVLRKELDGTNIRRDHSTRMERMMELTEHSSGAKRKAVQNWSRGKSQDRGMTWNLGVASLATCKSL